MAFDSTDYFRTEPAKVYDKDNPPTRMSEAIRMAVADVEALLDHGFTYDWGHADFIPHGSEYDHLGGDKRCTTCTAGAVIARMTNYEKYKTWFAFGDAWQSVFGGLSALTQPDRIGSLNEAFEEWPSGFAAAPTFGALITPANTDRHAFKRDMLNLADRLEAEGS